MRLTLYIPHRGNVLCSSTRVKHRGITAVQFSTKNIKIRHKVKRGKESRIWYIYNNIQFIVQINPQISIKRVQSNDNKSELRIQMMIFQLL